MNWKCICSKENEIEVIKCPDCKRVRPAYSKIDIELPIYDGGGTNPELLMAIVLFQYHTAFEKYEGLLNDEKVNDTDADAIRTAIGNVLRKSIKLIEHLKEKHPGFLYKEEDREYSYTSILCSIELLLGRVEYFFKNYRGAIDHLNNSFKLSPNQEALLFLANSVIRLPIEAGESMFKASKVEVAREIKEKLEFDLLIGVVTIDPLTAEGIQAGQLLVDKYGYLGLDSK